MSLLNLGRVECLPGVVPNGLAPIPVIKSCSDVGWSPKIDDGDGETIFDVGDASVPGDLGCAKKGCCEMDENVELECDIGCLLDSIGWERDPEGCSQEQNASQRVRPRGPDGSFSAKEIRVAAGPLTPLTPVSVPLRLRLTNARISLSLISGVTALGPRSLDIASTKSQLERYIPDVPAPGPFLPSTGQWR